VAGLSPVVRNYRKAGPAGLRWLPRSPPRRAGQASVILRATRFNPYRKAASYSSQFNFCWHCTKPNMNRKDNPHTAYATSTGFLLINTDSRTNIPAFHGNEIS
jgi:hypothetical protein